MLDRMSFSSLRQFDSFGYVRISWPNTTYVIEQDKAGNAKPGTKVRKMALGTVKRLDTLQIQLWQQLDCHEPHRAWRLTSCHGSRFEKSSAADVAVIESTNSLGVNDITVTTTTTTVTKVIRMRNA